MMRNTMSLGEYIKQHVFWALAAFLWLKNFLFRCIHGFTYTESLFGFAILSAIVMSICIAITGRGNRNSQNMIENIILCWGMFVCITYADIYSTRIVYTGIATALISLLLSILVLFRRIRRRDRRNLIIKCRLETVAILWKRNSAVASLVIMVPMVVSVFLYGTMLNANVEVTKVYGDEHRLQANIEVISGIEPERWKTLSIEEQLHVAQKIVNCEARYYGLFHEIMVGTDDLPAGTLAYYKDTTHQVIIDLEYLHNGYSYEVLETLIHEVHHAYQHNQVELYRRLNAEDRSLQIFYDASVYMEEFVNYEDGEENFYEYYTQTAEIHARKAGETESLIYIEAINEYLGIEQGLDMDQFSSLKEYLAYISTK